MSLKSGIDSMSTSSTFSRMIMINGDKQQHRQPQTKRKIRSEIDRDRSTTEILITQDITNDQYLNETSTVMSTSMASPVSKPIPPPPPPPPR